MKYLILPFLLLGLGGTLSTASAATDGPTMCTMEYAPVCAKIQVQCFRAPCYPVYKTYSNACMMSQENNSILVHNDACSTFEEGAPAVLSEWLKSFLQSAFDQFIQRIAALEANAQLLRLYQVDNKITARLNIVAPTPVDLVQEMRADTLRYELKFLQDITKTSIYNLEESITGKRYLFRDLKKCEIVRFKCQDGESFFTDEVGCGCKE